jgi:thiamine-phosphate pyrophosphorylase
MKIDFRLYLVTDRKQTKIPLTEAVRCALKGGVKAIQLREKDLPIRELLELARTLRSITREYKAKLIINDRVDIALAIGADGVHLGHQSMPPQPVRRILGKDMLVGVSTHTLEEAEAAEAGGADFITFGPVFFTQSKAGMGNPVGLDALKSVRSRITMPVFGLGGVKSGNAKQIIAVASGISLISAIFGADDIQKAAESMLREIE